MIPALYFDGTLSVEAGATTVTGGGTAWSSILRRGSLIIVGDVVGVVASATPGDLTFELAAPWPGATLVDATYFAVALRDGGSLTEGFSQLIDRLVGKGMGLVMVGPPSPDIGRDNDFIFDPVGRVLYFKVAGTWTPFTSRLVFDHYSSGGPRSNHDAKPQGTTWFDEVAQKWFVRSLPAPGSWAGPFEFRGPQGEKGWSPIHAAVVDGVRRIDQLVDWTGGEGAKPSGIGLYRAGLGYTAVLADATDTRGALGPQGWTIVPAHVADGDRVVAQVSSFAGGEGDPPTELIGLYVGPAGLTAIIAEAAEIRGERGLTGPRGVTWRGPWLIAESYVTDDLVTDDDALAQPALWIATAPSTGLRPRDNLGSWVFFPASMPALQDYGSIADAAADTRDYGSIAA